ncbi:MAG: hypothetical protein JWN98_1148 [Abditibacteriota bacterium]|nr:hypothetical protein [Abditibacteriota bacterium]
MTLLPLVLCAHSNAQLATEAVVARSVVNSTDLSRLRPVLAKARRGGKVTVAVIGGSITAGASATAPEKRYANRIAQWWRDTFPQAQIEFVNAGVGATGSHYGTLRAQRDLLSRQPDFVVVEYAVNDGNTREFAETLEGLLRQILRQPQRPAVLMLFMRHRGGANSQEWQSKLGSHYALPMISFRDAVQSEIVEGRLKEENVMADEVHPNDGGHELTAQLVTRYLDSVLKAMPTNTSAEAKADAIKATPPPLFTDLFEHVRFYDGVNLKPIENRGWTFDAPSGSWIAKTPGSVLACEVEGTLVSALTFRIKGPMGRARVQVDDRPPVMLEGWFDATWGGFIPVDIVARDLKPGLHRVQIEVLPDKAAESTGHEFRLFGFGAAGVAP